MERMTNVVDTVIKVDNCLGFNKIPLWLKGIPVTR